MTLLVIRIPVIAFLKTLNIEGMEIASISWVYETCILKSLLDMSVSRPHKNYTYDCSEGLGLLFKSFREEKYFSLGDSESSLWNSDFFISLVSLRL